MKRRRKGETAGEWWRRMSDARRDRPRDIDLDDYTAVLPPERQEKIAARVDALRLETSTEVLVASTDTKTAFGSTDESLSDFWTRILAGREPCELTDEERVAVERVLAGDEWVSDREARPHLYEPSRET